MGDNQEPTAEPLESALSVESTPQDPRLTLEAREAINAHLMKVTTSVGVVVGIVAFTVGFTLSEQSKSLAAKEIAAKVIEVDRAKLASEEAQAAIEEAQMEAEANRDLVAQARGEVDAVILKSQEEAANALDVVKEAREEVEAAQYAAQAALGRLEGYHDQIASNLVDLPGFRDQVLESLPSEVLKLYEVKLSEGSAEIEALAHELNSFRAEYSTFASHSAHWHGHTAAVWLDVIQISDRLSRFAPKDFDPDLLRVKNAGEGGNIKSDIETLLEDDFPMHGRQKMYFRSLLEKFEAFLESALEDE